MLCERRLELIYYNENPFQIFDDEVKTVAKNFTLGYERPKNFALPETDIVTKYFDIII